jgi:CO/xanthine dehydrogenase Mo-binding subunit
VNAAFANPSFGMQATGGSTTVRAHWKRVRKAGAAARAMLVAAAAEQWKLDPAQLDSAKVSDMLDDGARNADALARDDGNLRDAAATAAQTLDARNEAPHLAHACDSVEIWAGTQSQGPAQGILSQVAQVTPAQEKINTMMLGGGYGRRFLPPCFRGSSGGRAGRYRQAHHAARGRGLAVQDGGFGLHADSARWRGPLRFGGPGGPPA